MRGAALLIDSRPAARCSVLILGVPGSGKSTVCRLLSEAGVARWFSASATLRAAAKQDPEKAEVWERYWREGRNAPDSEVLPALWGAYTRNQASRIVLDGYPRTAEQFADFSQRGGSLAGVVILLLPDDFALSRIAFRSATNLRVNDDADLAKQRVRRERANISLLTRHVATSVHIFSTDARRHVELVTSDVADFLERYA